MPNLASFLKDEIRRLARKEIKSDVGVTKRASAQHRRDIAELKRLVKDLSKRVAFLESQERKRISTRAPERRRQARGSHLVGSRHTGSALDCRPRIMASWSACPR